MLPAYEKIVSTTLQEMENEQVIGPPREDDDYSALAQLVKERIGDFDEWKSTKRHFRGAQGVVKDIEIYMEDEIPPGTLLQGPFRLVSNPVDAARKLRDQIGDTASHNAYKILQAAIARSGPNHTDDVRKIFMEHFPAEQNIDILEQNLFHHRMWTPIE